MTRGVGTIGYRVPTRIVLVLPSQRPTRGQTVRTKCATEKNINSRLITPDGYRIVGQGGAWPPGWNEQRRMKKGQGPLDRICYNYRSPWKGLASRWGNGSYVVLRLIPHLCCIRTTVWHQTPTLPPPTFPSVYVSSVSSSSDEASGQSEQTRDSSDQ